MSSSSYKSQQSKGTRNVNVDSNNLAEENETFSFDVRQRSSRTKSSANKLPYSSFANYDMLGVQWNAEKDQRKYNRVNTIGKHVFQVAPITHFHSSSAESKFVTLTGDVNPIFQPDRFDNARKYLQGVNKQQRQTLLHAIGFLYAQRLSAHFINQQASKVDCVEFEKCFYPTYAPTYANALRAVNLPKPLWWRHHSFSGLQDISRLPLDRCDRDRTARMTFQQYFNLLWNYYQPFNTIAYLCYILAQSTLITKQLVDSVVEYLVYRHSLITDIKARNAPILFIGSRTGKFGAFINATKKLPVPIIHVHEKPQNNPYLLFIPPHKQSEFKPMPIVKMKPQLALEKYEPSIVLFSDMEMNTDMTSIIRKQGSVREYIYFGLADSYVQGNPWNTWGVLKYTTDRSERVPPYEQQGFRRMTLPYISRWMLYKLDNQLQIGNGVVTSWMRAPLYPSMLTRNALRLKRFAPLF